MTILHRASVMLLFVILTGGFFMQHSSFAAERGETTPSTRPVLAQKNMNKLFGSVQDPLAKTDPDLATIRDRFLYGEIAEQGSLNDKQRELITLVVLTASQSTNDIKNHTEAALRIGLSPVEIKEALYQCAPYIGFPKVEAALRQVNGVFTEKGIPLPVESQATVTEESRFADGLAVQKSTFGDAIDKMHAAAPAGQKEIIINYLSAFCFGDIFTRKGLDAKTRELLIFSAISALGGCESQVKSHVQGNINVGNSKQNLVDALAQSLPYIGFPRTLNALACVNDVVPEQ